MNAEEMSPLDLACQDVEKFKVRAIAAERRAGALEVDNRDEECGKRQLKIYAIEARCTALKKAARQVIKASPKCVGKDLLLALAELDTALAEAPEAGEGKKQ